LSAVLLGASSPKKRSLSNALSIELGQGGSMKQTLGRLREFIRYGHTHQKALYVTAFAVLVIFVLGLVFLLPHADHTSVQAGLTIVAEILGVLLGALLLVVERLVDQGQQAAQLLRTAYKEYYDLVKAHLEEIDTACNRLIDLAKGGKIKLDAPTFVGPHSVPSKTKYRDVIGNLIALANAMDSLGYDEAETTLDDLGFDQSQRDHILFGRGLSAVYDRAEFLKIVEDALDYMVLSEWCSHEISDLAIEILRKYMQGGVDRALSHLERSRSVLRSRSLAAGLFVLTSTILGSVMTLFGATDSTVGTPVYMWIVALITTGFLLSILVTLLLVDKIFVTP
jgi:hypothetical protein